MCNIMVEQCACSGSGYIRQYNISAGLLSHQTLYSIHDAVNTVIYENDPGFPSVSRRVNRIGN